MKNKIEYFFFILFSYVFRLLGTYISQRSAGILTIFVFYLVPVRKKVVVENLSYAFPEYDKSVINKIAFECYKSFLITLIEIMLMRNMDKSEIEKKVEIENPELITTKYKEGKGVILMSAHLGNWEYGAASVAAQVNIPFYVIVKSQRNPYVDKWMNEVRTKWNNKVVHLGISIRLIYQQLKECNVVAMVADQRGPAEGIKMDFFGRKTSVLTGPAVLALKTGAPIVYGLAVRQPDYSYRLVLHEIDKKDLPENYDDQVYELTRRQIAYLENAIRLHPEQWLWMHKRWKH